MTPTEALSGELASMLSSCTVRQLWAEQYTPEHLQARHPELLSILRRVYPGVG